MRTVSTKLRLRRRSLAVAFSASLAVTSAGAAPGIRTTAANPVPQCVTPERLMAFLGERNSNLDPRFRDIARWYKYWGDAWRVRWDYAFFQMAIETNFLTYRTGAGRMGDVNPKQNNFAGIGTTGGGVPGDRFPDVKTGVLGQIQHLVAYSGEKLAAPVAPRTRLKQNDIVDLSLRLNRPVTFADLARRWAVDKKYGASIDWVAQRFYAGYCSKAAAPVARAPAIVPAPVPATRVNRASYAPPYRLGGPKPQGLAGPEILPWNPAPSRPSNRRVAEPSGLPPADTSIGNHPSTGNPLPANRSPAGERSPFRTIWSRDEAGGTVAAAPPAPARIEPAPAAPPAIPHVEAAPADTEQDAPLLPFFRIAPVGPAPSRLGGPMPAVSLPSKLTRTPARTTCRIMTASYGGTRTLLVSAVVNGETELTALTVLDGFEQSMFDTYTKEKAPGGELIASFDDRPAALASARALCAGE